MSEPISIWHLYVWAGTACGALATALVSVWKSSTARNTELVDKFIKALQDVVAENKTAMDGVASRLNSLESHVADHVTTKRGCVEDVLTEIRTRMKSTPSIFSMTPNDEHTHGR